MVKPSVFLSLACCLSACTWVKPDALSSRVALAKPSEVTDCKRIGFANVKTLGRIVVVPRSANKVAEELVTLAQREAAVMGGDTIVADSLVDGGSQVFAVYRCP